MVASGLWSVNGVSRSCCFSREFERAGNSTEESRESEGGARIGCKQKLTNAKKKQRPSREPASPPPAREGADALDCERAGLKAWREGRRDEASALLLSALARHAEPEKAILRYPFQVLPSLAERAYQILNSPEVRRSERFPPDLAGLMVDFGYLTPVRPLVRMIAGKDVLDFGCGGGLMGPAFLVCGARSYTGIDLQADLGRREAQNKRLRRKMPFPYSPAELMEQLPRMRVRTGDDAVLGAEERFDVATMLMVTEHLMDLEGVLASLSRVIRPGGKLYFSHHNYYCWNGHHLPPRTVDQIAPNNPRQAALYDWNHVMVKPPPGHYAATNLNQVRIGELRSMVEKHYDIVDWQLVPTDEARGSRRLTPAILAKLPEYSEEELLTQAVKCTAVPKVAQ